ncbi:MAG: hypothetical protein M1581_01785 [Candidatus Thermoplasmatota archaeon]|nr:hypothetical protein [Candidatus Thermoplasmatota archaeon]
MHNKEGKIEKNHGRTSLKKFLLSLIVVSILLVFFVPVASSAHTAISRPINTRFSPPAPSQSTKYNVNLKVVKGLPDNSSWIAQLTNSTESTITNMTNNRTASFSVPDGNYTVFVMANTGAGANYKAYLGKHNYVTPLLNVIDYGFGFITVNGASININVTFFKEYYVNVTESGLPPVNSWAVQWPANSNETSSLVGPCINNATGASGLSTELAINGTYSYEASTTVSGYHAYPSTGSFTISGHNISLQIEFSNSLPRGDYFVNFTTSSFSSATYWSVTINGNTQSSSPSGISFVLKNGTYPYVIGSPDSYYASPSNGTVYVNGSSQVISISFFPSISKTPPIWAFAGAYSNYSITMTNNSGIISGFLYYKILSVNDTSQTIHIFESKENINGSVTNSYRNGSWTNFSYAYDSYELGEFNNNSSVPNVTIKTNILYTTSMGTFTVDELNFISSNLSIKVYIDTLSGILVSLQEQNTTVKISMNLSSTNMPNTGKTQTTKYNVTFTESGLPSGTSWFVTLNGSKQSSTSSTITFSETNGTYTYTVGQVTGYNISSPSGNAKVSGTYLNITITYTNTTSSKASGFTISPLEEYGAVGGMIAVIGGAAGMIIKKKR